MTHHSQTGRRGKKYQRFTDALSPWHRTWSGLRGAFFGLILASIVFLVSYSLELPLSVQNSPGPTVLMYVFLLLMQLSTGFVAGHQAYLTYNLKPKPKLVPDYVSNGAGAGAIVALIYLALYITALLNAQTEVVELLPSSRIFAGALWIPMLLELATNIGLGAVGGMVAKWLFH